MVTIKQLKTWAALFALGGLAAVPASADHMMMGPMMMGDTADVMTGPCGMDAGSGMTGMGWGMGPGMMGPGMQGGAIPNLTDEQRKQLSSIRREASDKHWNLMGKVRTERLHLQDLYSAESADPDAIGAQQKKLLALRQQMIDVSVDAQKRVDALLTKEQKEALRTWRRGWMMGRQ